MKLFATGLITSLLLLTGCDFPSGGGSASEAKKLQDSELQQILGDNELVLLKFGAEWCGPCVMVDKELGKLESSHGGSVKITLIDVDKNPDLTKQFGVSGIPHMFLYRNGERVDDLVGMRHHDALVRWVEESGASEGGSSMNPPPTGAIQSNPY